VISGTIRLAPPLIISEEDLEWGLDQIEAVARELGQR
jgi:acetylornithine/succinyldiaminopimelate/putrescine aminotransferase